MLADDWNRLRGRYVVAGFPISMVRNSVEVLSDKLLPARESVAAAHRVIMPDWMSVHEGAAVVT
jgi:hypothetical protein